MIQAHWVLSPHPRAPCAQQILGRGGWHWLLLSPDSGWRGPVPHRCFWAILLLALTVSLLAGFLHKDVRLLMP